MPKQAPVVLLAFANDRNDYLTQLQNEQDALKEILLPLDQAGVIDLQIMFETSVDNIFNAFSRDFPNRIMIFHYAGHANSASLLLREGEANATGLAKLINQQENLQLIVLNGCSTEEQVKELMKGNIPNVIATSVPINDHKAVTFAKQFYTSLASEASVLQAYEAAIARLQTTGNNAGIENNSVRTFGNRMGEVVIPAEPWNLFRNEDASSDWKITDGQAPTLDEFKKQMYEHIDNGEFQNVFDEVKASDYKYQKFLLNNLANQMAFGLNFNQVQQLKVLIGSLREPS